MAECLETLVGLTDIDCECFSDLQPKGWDTSDSGRYLTDPEVGFPTLEAVFQSVDCGKEFWQMMTKARTDAIRDFRHELGVNMRKYNTPRLPVFRGTLGETRFRFRIQKSDTYVGMLIRCKNWRDAQLKINRIGLNISTVSTVTIHIVSNDPDFEPLEIEVTTEANKTTFVEIEDAPLVLNFSSENTNEMYYAIYYTIPDGATANENKVTCGCGGNDPVRKGVLLAGSFSSNDLEDLEDVVPGSHAYGLSLDCFLDCDYTGFLCNLSEFSAQDLLDDVAAAIQARGAAKLISSVIETGKINRYTLKPLEELYGRRNRLQKNFAEYVDAIAKNYRQDLSGCWTCKSNSTWQRRAINV